MKMYTLKMTIRRLLLYLNRSFTLIPFGMVRSTCCYDFIHLYIHLLQEMPREPSNKAGLRFISGIICKSKALRFERMLFRATRGNMFFNQATAEQHVADPVSGEMVCFPYFICF